MPKAKFGRYAEKCDQALRTKKETDRQTYRFSFVHRVPKKGSHFYFLNSSMRHWPILIIFGMQHQEETWCK